MSGGWIPPRTKLSQNRSVRKVWKKFLWIFGGNEKNKEKKMLDD